MITSLCLPVLQPTLRCHVAAGTLVRGSEEIVAQRRRQPVAIGAEKLPVSFLKHADDQTVLALSAVLDVLASHGWQDRSFADWGVVAAANFFGRRNIAQAIKRFQVEGAWGVSPHLIPHQSLHAISGTISQALKIHGPNFGIGGGPNAGPDAFLIAAAMMADGLLPGLWLILTGHESEWIRAADGLSAPAPSCHAAVFALTSDEACAHGSYLALGELPPDEDPASTLAHLPEFHLNLLAEEWALGSGLPSGRWRLADTHWLEIESPNLAMEDRA